MTASPQPRIITIQSLANDPSPVKSAKLAKQPSQKRIRIIVPKNSAIHSPYVPASPIDLPLAAWSVINGSPTCETRLASNAESVRLPASSPRREFRADPCSSKAQRFGRSPIDGTLPQDYARSQ